MGGSMGRAGNAMTKGYAVVTGASQGLGEAIALDLAGHGFGIIAVARNRDKLDAVVQACGRSNGGRVAVIAMDLAATGAVDALVTEVQRLDLPIQVLVNNAGYAVWGRFPDQPVEEHLRMLHLNTAVPMELTHRLLPMLLRQTPSFILNVSSMTAYSAVSTLASYTGSKAFLRHWSRSLRMDMKGTGVEVCCVCPGTVLTGFTERAGMQALDKLAEKFGTPPGPVARSAVKALLGGKAEVVPGVLDGITAQLMRSLPDVLTERIASGIYIKHLPR